MTIYITVCADTSIIRTPSRQELLYARSQIVVAAKAFGLDAIDMVGDELNISRIFGHHLITRRRFVLTIRISIT